MATKQEQVQQELIERKMLLAQLGQGSKVGKVNFVRKLEGVTKTVDGFSGDPTVYFHGCKDCTFTLPLRCTKILIHECDNCHFVVQGNILTHMLEAWKCKSFVLDSAAEIRTLQLDMIDVAKVKFTKKDIMGTLAWTGVEDLSLAFDDDATVLNSGFSDIKKTDVDATMELSQYYVRWVDGELLQEKVLRLPNGFPTTKREADEFDKQQAIAAIQKEQYVRGLMKFAENKIGIQDNRKAPPGGRNDPCHCGSGKKRKNCCGDWIKGARPANGDDAELPEMSKLADPAKIGYKYDPVDPRALPVDDLDIGATTVKGRTAPSAAGGIVEVIIDDSVVGTTKINPDGSWRLGGIDPLEEGKAVCARIGGTMPQLPEGGLTVEQIQEAAKEAARSVKNVGMALA